MKYRQLYFIFVWNKWLLARNRGLNTEEYYMYSGEWRVACLCLKALSRSHLFTILFSDLFWNSGTVVKNSRWSKQFGDGDPIELEFEGILNIRFGLTSHIIIFLVIQGNISFICSHGILFDETCSFFDVWSDIVRLTTCRIQKMTALNRVKKQATYVRRVNILYRCISAGNICHKALSGHEVWVGWKYGFGFPTYRL